MEYLDDSGKRVWEDKGTINLGDKVSVSDPCYSPDVWCSTIIKNVLPGEYTCKLMRYEGVYVYGDGYEENVSNRCAAIDIYHKDYQDIEPIEYKSSAVIGVDSGQAGFYDADYKHENGYLESDEDLKDLDISDREKKADEWYNKVCDLTLTMKDNKNYKPFVQTKRFREFIDGVFSDNRKEYIQGIIKEFYGNSENDLKVMTEDSLKSLENPVFKNVGERLSELSEQGKYTEEEISYLENLEKKLNGVGHGLLIFALKQRYDYSNEGSEKVESLDAGILDGKCFVSSSGWGDGEYELYVGMNKEGKIVSMRIDFGIDPTLSKCGEERA